MKFSEQWLKEWVPTDLNAAEITQIFTMAGLEVDQVLPVAEEFSGVVVGKILKADKHPDADRLKICQVDIGQAEKLTIVCGGANARAGINVAVATVGAVLPEGTVIKKSNIRGQVSQGMLCSETELKLAESSAGILEFSADDRHLGEDFRHFLALEDKIFDMDLTPNRGDCLSIKGLARELAALINQPFKEEKITKINNKLEDEIKVIVESTDRCPKYLGRVVRGFDMSKTTPLWMQEKLRRSGLRPINIIVDVTNYVMLELGQPLHAFDCAKIDQNIVVRQAHENEQILTLNGQQVHLKPDTLIIADQSKALAIAGIIGGQHSAVAEQTTAVFVECAYFEPVALAASSRQYAIHTDGLHRFERGVDFNLQSEAIEKTTKLIIEIAGGVCGPITESTAPQQLPAPIKLQLRPQRIKQILGFAIDETTVENILSRLHFAPQKINGAWQVNVPSFRFDVQKEIDLIEEIIRVYGYQNIPRHLPVYAAQMKAPQMAHIVKSDFSKILQDRGYIETISYSFGDDRREQQLFKKSADFILTNPISNDMNAMRSSLWPGLLKSAEFNLARQVDRLRLFEIGVCFHRHGEKIIQDEFISGLITGSKNPEQWATKNQPVDFYDVKNDVEALLALTHALNQFDFIPTNLSCLHPGNACQIMHQNQAVGYLGALHPEIQQAFNLTQNIYLFEIKLSLINNKIINKFKVISKFPSIRRDIAISVDEKLASHQLLSNIINRAGELLQNARIFDIYQGEGVDPGKKSVAIALTFQHPSRTLVEEEINSIMQNIIQGLQTLFKASLRN